MQKFREDADDGEAYVPDAEATAADLSAASALVEHIRSRIAALA